MECTVIIKDSKFVALNSIWLIEKDNETELKELTQKLTKNQHNVKFRLQYFINNVVSFMGEQGYKLYLVEREVPTDFYLETILYFTK